MEKARLGRTNLQVTRTSFGALPIQRVDIDTAGSILRRAFEAGINFYDTARAYTDSEAKLGCALADVRDEIVIATKSPSGDRARVMKDVETSLRELKTDRVDILQLHNPRELSDAADGESAYAGLAQARREGKTRFIGITEHRLDVAVAAAESGLYDTVQFPISMISDAKELRLVEVCKVCDVGLIAMKALCGGLVRNIRAAFAFYRQFASVVPIWGVQRMAELEQFLALDADPPELDDELRAAIEADRGELAGDFCRGCGYCLPCPAEIPIPMAARMAFLMRRAPTKGFLAPAWQRQMARIDDCIECGDCRERCPYGLDTPALLKRMYEDYKTFL
ncbi:MAG TPA: aldo/keto reductase [Phycisphaerae bacterium]|nr:aldo/keto reductase [Phycisphaerae bacterium]